MTANDSVKSQCVHSGMKGQVGGFQSSGVSLQAFPFFPSPLALFYLLHFLSGNSLLLNLTEMLATQAMLLISILFI